MHIGCDRLRENSETHTYPIGTVIDSVSSVLEETTDIMNEKSMTAGEGRKSRGRSQWWVIEREEEGKFLNCLSETGNAAALSARANLITFRL